MSNTTAAAVGALLGRMRDATGGSMAVLLGPDQQPLAADSARGAEQTPAWEAALREVTARWALWHECERADPAFDVDGMLLLTGWVAPHGVVLVDLVPGDTIGLARLRVRPLLAELQRTLDRNGWSGGDGGAGGAGGAGGMLAAHSGGADAEDETVEGYIARLSEMTDLDP